MIRIAVSILALSLLAGPAAAQNYGTQNYGTHNYGKWGAIAYGGPVGATGTAVDYPSREEAREAALEACGGRCTRAVSFLRTCAAVAESPSGSATWSANRFRDRAIARALKQCANSDCSVLAWACTTH